MNQLISVNMTTPVCDQTEKSMDEMDEQAVPSKGPPILSVT